MGQIKIYGLAKELNQHKKQLSEALHSCMVDAFKIPQNKKFHRFISLEPESFYFPDDRSEKYTIIEISIFEGRSNEAKKQLIKLLFTRIKEQVGIDNNDLEITIFETPKCNWGIRGVPGDELELNYKVNV